MIEMFLKLLIGHAIMDFWAQSDFVAKAKNRNHPLGQDGMWVYALTAHALMHGAAVWFITGNVWLGVGETVVHWLIDFGKCENVYGIHTDQASHVSWKFLWATLA